jgi:tRNA A-37 threonylcarbamoyl transferase component Bud32
MSDTEAVETGLVGQTLGEFFVRRLLGSGGMGDVYEADQTALQRRVALKVLREELVKDPAYLHRFQAEARTIARIQHPNIVSVITIGERSGTHFMAMEFVDGRNLRDHIARQGALEEKDAVAILKKTAAALQRAHEEGVVHRDVKPENILITRRAPNRPSEVKVADFGLARRMAGEVSVTQSGMTMGTPLYMSPEQIRGHTVDPRSDVYSLGVTAYHMLAGEPPYSGDSPMAVAIKHLQGNATPLQQVRNDLSPDLCRLIERMMSVRVEDRVASAADVLKELNRLRPANANAPRELVDFGATISATAIAAPMKPLPTASLSQRMTQMREAVSNQRRLPWVAPLSLMLALIGGGVLAWVFRERDPFAAPIAAAEYRPKAVDAGTVPSDPIEHFEEAHGSTAERREAALWGVLDAHHSTEPESVSATLSAALELYRMYIASDDEALVEEVVRWLSDSSRGTEQRTYGSLFNGFILARTGDAEKARKTFDAALRGKTTTEPGEFDRSRLQSLAEEFNACLHRLGSEGGEPSSERLREAFWRRFTPQAPTRPGKGK